MFLIGDHRQQLLNLHYAEYLWQLMRFTGIKRSRDNKGSRVNMFEKKAASLCCLVAFFTTHPMLFNDKANVINDILLANPGGQAIVIVSKKKPYFLHVIADGTG